MSSAVCNLNAHLVSALLRVVVDGKSRPLVRMFITRSTRSQAPRRRRRPKNMTAVGSTLRTTAASSSSLAPYHVDHLNQELSAAEVSDFLTGLINHVT